ncbi:hypothetical protein BCR42DRAFT_198281 [Absidia repens]|uniref:Uncharacterized protein n=1 Tax=Absidia repens TaxID=90262 RepID=A0A1X2HXI3_9FUNG|nr:hypothetical protein BCR42DRAFT_198281 [Absidia repens]
MTLTTICLVTPARYAFIKVRSGRIPTSYEERWDWAKVIELLLKLKRDLMDQEGVTKLLKQEQKVARIMKGTVKGDVKKAMMDAM